MELVKELVDTHGFSKYQIKKMVGVSWVTVSHWYRGVYSPNQEHSAKLKEILTHARKIAQTN